MFDPYLDAVAGDADHLELDLAVREQDAILGSHVVLEAVVVDGDGVIVAGFAGDEVHGIADGERGGADLAGPDFGTAEVLQDGHGFAHGGAFDANHFRAAARLRMVAAPEGEKGKGPPGGAELPG